jgi:hypothetical protein
MGSRAGGLPKPLKENELRAEYSFGATSGFVGHLFSLCGLNEKAASRSVRLRPFLSVSILLNRAVIHAHYF